MDCRLWLNENKVIMYNTLNLFPIIAATSTQFENCDDTILHHMFQKISTIINRPMLKSKSKPISMEYDGHSSTT